MNTVGDSSLFPPQAARLRALLHAVSQSPAEFRPTRGTVSVTSCAMPPETVATTSSSSVLHHQQVIPLEGKSVCVWGGGGGGRRLMQLQEYLESDYNWST